MSSFKDDINFIKVILKLECLFYQNFYIYIYYCILFYIRRAISTQTNPKKGLIEEKNPPTLQKTTLKDVILEFKKLFL